VFEVYGFSSVDTLLIADAKGFVSIVQLLSRMWPNWVRLGARTLRFQVRCLSAAMRWVTVGLILHILSYLRLEDPIGVGHAVVLSQVL
jgi:hypothetical protein